MDSTRTLIVGAGMAGLTAARHLADHGLAVTVLEKSRGVGGRISTRRGDHGTFDHGAQYLTSRTPELNALVARLAENGVLAPWRPVGKDNERQWWVGQPGMSAIGKVLGEGLDVRLQSRVVGMAPTEGGYQVEIETENREKVTITAGRVMAAIPAPQAYALLSPVDTSFSALDGVEINPCWAMMVAFEKKLDTVPDLIRGKPSDVLSIVSRNSSKPGRSGEAFVLHASPEWSRAHLEDDRQSVADVMLSAMRGALGPRNGMPDPAHVAVHRWRYAQTETPLHAPFIANADSTLLACGDWCSGARIEAAHQSGLAAARHVTSL